MKELIAAYEETEPQVEEIQPQPIKILTRTKSCPNRKYIKLIQGHCNCNAVGTAKIICILMKVLGIPKQPNIGIENNIPGSDNEQNNGMNHLRFEDEQNSEEEQILDKLVLTIEILDQIVG